MSETRITVNDLAGVIYSAGRVFENLSTGRLATESFLRTGSTAAIMSRADLALLEDLRDAARVVIAAVERHSSVNAELVTSINAAMIRSGALHPGQLRTDDQRITVRTEFGVYAPSAPGIDGLRRLISEQTSDPESDTVEEAARLFVAIAAAQPFEDANKRTALLTANVRLLTESGHQVLTIPCDENDASIQAEFSRLLARAYYFSEREPVIQMLASQGVRTLEAARENHVLTSSEDCEQGNHHAEPEL